MFCIEPSQRNAKHMHSDASAVSAEAKEAQLSLRPTIRLRSDFQLVWVVTELPFRNKDKTRS